MDAAQRVGTHVALEAVVVVAPARPCAVLPGATVGVRADGALEPVVSPAALARAVLVGTAVGVAARRTCALGGGAVGLQELPRTAQLKKNKIKVNDYFLYALFRTDSSV